MSQYNVWNKWDPLRAVMLGTAYTSEFFRDIKDSNVRSALQQIADETEEDLEYFAQVLRDFGCTVIRPELDRTDSILNYTNSEGAIRNRVPRSPLQPRDQQLVLGNQLVYVNEHDHPAIKRALDQYNSECAYISFDNKEYTTTDRNEIFANTFANKYSIFAGPDWPTVDQCLSGNYNTTEFIAQEIQELHQHVEQLISNYQANAIGAPSITVVGRDLYVDSHVTQFDRERASAVLAPFRVNSLTIGGHNDACFAPLKPGVLLSLYDIQKYENTFPGWDVCYLPDQSWKGVKEFMQLRNQTNGKWWVPGQETNTAFTEFVETWLQDWVGYVEETVFDVNVLVLDEHHVCVNNINNTQVNEFFRKHRIEPVHVPWRHRYFWDGGLHCITLDLYREGNQQDYFPERSNAITDLGAIL